MIHRSRHLRTLESLLDRHPVADLNLDRLDVVHAGEHTFPLTERVRALALARLEDDLPSL